MLQAVHVSSVKIPVPAAPRSLKLAAVSTMGIHQRPTQSYTGCQAQRERNTSCRFRVPAASNMKPCRLLSPTPATNGTEKRVQRSLAHCFPPVQQRPRLSKALPQARSCRPGRSPPASAFREVIQRGCRGSDKHSKSNFVLTHQDNRQLFTKPQASKAKALAP